MIDLLSLLFSSRLLSSPLISSLFSSLCVCVIHSTVSQILKTKTKHIENVLLLSLKWKNQTAETHGLSGEKGRKERGNHWQKFPVKFLQSRFYLICRDVLHLLQLSNHGTPRIFVPVMVTISMKGGHPASNALKCCQLLSSKFHWQNLLGKL